jgi:hypothetical protein
MGEMAITSLGPAWESIGAAVCCGGCEEKKSRTLEQTTCLRGQDAESRLETANGIFQLWVLAEFIAKILQKCMRLGKVFDGGIVFGSRCAVWV